ncbi:MAG: PadR family transcriptional regulator [Treponema sp.]|nr:PadR family transcriptional regulator [Treponema sp.]
MDEKISSDMLRGHTDTIVLSILSRGDSYGYEISKVILENSGGLFELKEATLYASFRRLEQDGFIAPYWGDESQGGRRRYYRITAKGRELYRKNLDGWRFTNRILSKLFMEESI